MNILNTLTLKSNRQIKINFNGGDLSSDAGLLLIKEFAAKIGFTKLIKRKFKTNDKSVRFHKDDENLMQMIYQIISAYFNDDCADELTLDPVFNAILDKERLASQPTLSGLSSFCVSFEKIFWGEKPPHFESNRFLNFEIRVPVLGIRLICAWLPIFFRRILVKVLPH